MQSLVIRSVCKCNLWIKYFSFFVSFFLGRLGTKVIIIHRDRNYGYPMNLLLKEYMGIFFIYDELIKFYLSLCQFIPVKNGWALIYYTPLTPNLYFGSAINFLIKSAAWGLTSASFGITKYFLQFWILCHVYLGYSDAKGGYPTNISYKITPIDHQSTVSV